MTLDKRLRDLEAELDRAGVGVTVLARMILTEHVRKASPGAREAPR